MVLLFLAKFFSFFWLSFLFFFLLHNNMEKLFSPRSFLSTLLELHPRNYENKVEHCSTPFSPLDCHSWQQERPIITWSEIMIISSCRIWVARKRDGFVNLSLKLPHKCVRLEFQPQYHGPGIPQPLFRGPVPGRGLLGTGPCKHQVNAWSCIHASSMCEKPSPSPTATTASSHNRKGWGSVMVGS